jgi:hypothetical protein
MECVVGPMVGSSVEGLSGLCLFALDSRRVDTARHWTSLGPPRELQAQEQ